MTNFLIICNFSIYNSSIILQYFVVFYCLCSLPFDKSDLEEEEEEKKRIIISHLQSKEVKKN
jgi:hypothetical protein